MALQVPLAGLYSSALVEPAADAIRSSGHQHLAVRQQGRRVIQRAVLRLPVVLNVNGASTGDSLDTDAGPAIARSLFPCATGAMAALSPLAAGAALKLEANKIAEIEISATARVIWSAEAPVEFFCRFFIEFTWHLRNQESSSRGALNSGLASADSGFQLDLEIA